MPVNHLMNKNLFNGLEISLREMLRDICRRLLTLFLSSVLIRITNLQNAIKQVPLIQTPQHSATAQGAVQMRIKNSQSSADRLSQSKSMVLQDSDIPQKPVCKLYKTKLMVYHLTLVLNVGFFLL